MFKVAGISTLFVAVTVAKMASAQVLSLDDKLSDYFPELEGRIANANKYSNTNYVLLVVIPDNR